jgi:hypothetical protein
MTRKDRNALKLAMTMARKDAAKARQLDDKLADGEPWEQVAQFAAYGCQFRSLKLRPWECAPLDADCEFSNSPGALALLKRMQRAGVSRWHPDPMAALSAAEAERAEAEAPATRRSHR